MDVSPATGWDEGTKGEQRRRRGRKKLSEFNTGSYLKETEGEIYICKYIHMCICMHVYVYVYIYIYVRMSVYTNIYIYIHIYMYAYKEA